MSKILVYALLIATILIPSPVASATIHGTIYEWCTLEPIKGVVIEVNSTPKQVIIASSAIYSFNLPEGSYVIKAKYYSNGVLEYYCEENLTIAQEGDYVLDLLMLPAPFEETLFGDDIENIDVGEFADNKGLGIAHYILVLVGFAVLALILLYFYFKKRKKDLPEDLPEDLGKIMEILTREGGRMTQTELRKQLPYSEAKISLMLSDLEDRGLIKKIKKGKGNIIIKL